MAWGEIGAGKEQPADNECSLIRALSVKQAYQKFRPATTDKNFQKPPKEAILML